MLFVLSSCGFILTDHSNDYLKEKQIEPIAIPDETESRQIIDFYPVEPLEEKVSQNFRVPRPEQVFSSGTSNEIRMHKLGELRWLYVEILPSSSWPIMRNFWESSKFGLQGNDPNQGILESQEYIVNNQVTKFITKIEHGIRQASTEIFISHLIESDGSWIRVDQDQNLEEEVLRSALDYLAASPSSGGTSLVALNLNLGQKAALKQDTENKSFIELDLEYARAWAAVDRALQEAMIEVKDLNREDGVFYVEFSNKIQDRGFFSKIFRRSEQKASFIINIEKINDDRCSVTVVSESELGSIMERDLLSEINQSLS
tara:strand:- start:31915 stop:32859 length:945 start_codon:yes stop_codon:yes gene_type:complete